MQTGSQAGPSQLGHPFKLASSWLVSGYAVEKMRREDKRTLLKRRSMLV